MNSVPSLGDILQAAINGTDPKEYVRQQQTMNSAHALADFLKTLPDSVNTFQLLNTITKFVGDEVATEALRSMMGIRRENGSYFLQQLSGFSRPDKISTIRIVRNITNTSLRDAKDFVEGTACLKLSADQIRRINSEVREFGYRVAYG